MAGHRPSCWAWVSILIVLAFATAACASTASSGEGNTTTTVRGTADATTMAPPTSSTRATVSSVPRACTPGCALKSSHDAITVMASSATLVAVVIADDVQDSGGVRRAEVSVDKTLQGNAYNNVYPPTTPNFQVTLGAGTTLVQGKSYLVFMSYNRGGSCLSSLFSYDSTSKVATFIEQADGPQANEIVVSRRVLTVPRTITVGELQARMYPKGGVVYPDDTAEWFCPGP